MSREVEFCTTCKKENPPDRDTCECGSRNFVYGGDISLEDDKLICRCGKTEFEFKLHINGGKIHERVFVCRSCSNVVKFQTYMGDDSYWDEY